MDSYSDSEYAGSDFEIEDSDYDYCDNCNEDDFHEQVNSSYENSDDSTGDPQFESNYEPSSCNQHTQWDGDPENFSDEDSENDSEERYGANSVVEHYVGNEYNGVIKQPLRENKQVPSQAINLQHLFAQRMKDLKEKHCLQWKSLLDTRFQTQQQHKFYGNQLSMRQDQERLQINQWYQQQLDSIKLQITQRKRVGTKTTAEGANAEVTTQTVESTEDIPKVPKFK